MSEDSKLLPEGWLSKGFWVVINLVVAIICQIFKDDLSQVIKNPAVLNGLIFLLYLGVGIGLCYLYFSRQLREVPTLKEEIESLKNEKQESDQKISELEKARDSVQQVREQLSKPGIVGDLWCDSFRTPSSVTHPPDRKTRFISVINLKGGVGKTTISANLFCGPHTNKSRSECHSHRSRFSGNGEQCHAKPRTPAAVS